MRRTRSAGWSKHGPDAEVTRAWIEPVLRSREVRRDVAKILKGISTRYTLEAAERLREFERPALIAWAPEDRFFKFTYAERLAAAIPDSRLERIEDSWTYVCEDQPERLAELVAGFVTGDGSAPLTGSRSRFDRGSLRSSSTLSAVRDEVVRALPRAPSRRPPSLGAHRRLGGIDALDSGHEALGDRGRRQRSVRGIRTRNSSPLQTCDAVLRATPRTLARSRSRAARDRALSMPVLVVDSLEVLEVEIADAERAAVAAARVRSRRRTAPEPGRTVQCSR